MSGHDKGGRPLPARFGPCPICATRVLMIYRTEADPAGNPARHDCVIAIGADKARADSLATEEEP